MAVFAHSVQVCLPNSTGAITLSQDVNVSFDRIS